MKTLYIEWEDSISLSGQIWHKQDNPVAPIICKTAGFVIEENKRSITIASHITPAGGMAGDITIPKRAITKRRILSRKK